MAQYGAAQASLAISDVDNDFKSEVTNSKLNIKNKTNINATSNTLDMKSLNQQGVGSLRCSIRGSWRRWRRCQSHGTTNASISNTKGNFDNLLNLNTLGVSLAGTGAGVGLSVDILKTKDKTTTAVNNSDITLILPIKTALLKTAPKSMLMNISKPLTTPP